jgi:MFS family permease
MKVLQLSITKLGSFHNTYQLNTVTISNIVSLVNVGAGVGVLLSFLINDRIGRLWSLRVYQTIYLASFLISCLSNGNHGALYAGKIVAGLGIGALTVVGHMTIVEVAPKSTRGLMTLWFSACMLSGQVIGVFAVYGSSVHMSPTKNLQYQVPWFVQTFDTGYQHRPFLLHRRVSTLASHSEQAREGPGCTMPSSRLISFLPVRRQIPLHPSCIDYS